MKEQFVPYRLALKFKELGFDEGCFGYSYRDTPDKKSSLNIYFVKQPINNSSLKEDKGIALPLWQQAFDWFRNQYGIDSTILPTSSTKYLYRLYKQQSKSKTQIYGEYMSKEYKTYEKARQACLEKLIEICKKN